MDFNDHVRAKMGMIEEKRKSEPTPEERIIQAAKAVAAFLRTDILNSVEAAQNMDFTYSCILFWNGDPCANWICYEKEEVLVKEHIFSARDEYITRTWTLNNSGIQFWDALNEELKADRIVISDWQVGALGYDVDSDLKPNGVRLEMLGRAWFSLYNLNSPVQYYRLIEGPFPYDAPIEKCYHCDGYEHRGADRKDLRKITCNYGQRERKPSDEYGFGLSFCITISYSLA